MVIHSIGIGLSITVLIGTTPLLLHFIPKVRVRVPFDEE